MHGCNPSRPSADVTAILVRALEKNREKPGSYLPATARFEKRETLSESGTLRKSG